MNDKHFSFDEDDGFDLVVLDPVNPPFTLSSSHSSGNNPKLPVRSPPEGGGALFTNRETSFNFTRLDFNPLRRHKLSFDDYTHGSARGGGAASSLS